ncbi:MAG TPA: ATP synthase F1 subunit epsilon [Acidimicrobiales bacterium]|nr:ATP synthase F1 subunit epsilon [Acidimicrobiales bacterium]
MATLKVEIVTPESALWVGEAKALIARSADGEFMILPQHTATVGDVVAGIVRVDTDAGEVAFAVHGGYFQVGADDVENQTLATVLAGVAERTTEIDADRALAAKESAETALVAANANPDDHAARALAQGALERAELRLRAVQR